MSSGPAILFFFFLSHKPVYYFQWVLRDHYRNCEAIKWRLPCWQKSMWWFCALLNRILIAQSVTCINLSNLRCRFGEFDYDYNNTWKAVRTLVETIQPLSPARRAGLTYCLFANISALYKCVPCFRLNLRCFYCRCCRKRAKPDSDQVENVYKEMSAKVEMFCICQIKK